MAFNDDMDSYLRGRKRGRALEFVNRPRDGPGWWDQLWAPKPRAPEEDLMPDEQAKLEAIEHDLDRGEVRIERARDPAQQAELSMEQEDKVSFYHRLRGLFAKERKVEDAYDELEHSEPMNVVIAADVTDDFRTLASIQVRWFDRMPTRVKDEFKTSEDYEKYVEILQRRGVARKK